MGWFSSAPKLPDGPTRLPSYFPVQPKGCEKVSSALFECVTESATAKARDLEKVGFHTSYFRDVATQPANTAAAERIADLEDPNLPKPGENPLDQCRGEIGNYIKCCNRELQKRKNWLLTEPYRVQEEYRYTGNQSEK